MNTTGERVRLTTWGESHGVAVGGVIDGFPAGFIVDFEELADVMEERRPGRPGVSARREDDEVEFLSGINPEGITLGTPISFLIRNLDRKPEDYEPLADAFRPNHADYTYHAKYGIRDWRGGGRASARETACRVVAGALAMQWLNLRDIEIKATRLSPSEEEIEAARADGDSIGGIVECVVIGVPAGVGEPVYGKLSARLAAAMMSINAVKGFEIGDGFAFASRRGSEVIDEFYTDENGEIKTRTNHSGGIQGGISNGMPIVMRVVFKPTPTIGKPLPLMHENGETATTSLSGRHDPCVAVRGTSVVRAMAALVIMDMIIEAGL